MPTIDKFLKKGLQSTLDITEINNCALMFTLDTKRLYIDDGTSRTQITDVIFGMTEAQIINNNNPLPKFYVASDTLKVYISDGTNIAIVEADPVAITSTDLRDYYPIMRSADGVNKKGYTSDLSFNPSTKETNIGDIRITQSTNSGTGDKTIDIYISNS